ncbi:hypothetical protein QYF36_017856 [Acer negundo]|nr:hypothetical protein QYF36_017856 [Acer negundo]
MQRYLLGNCRLPTLFFFLTNGGTETFYDVRRNSLEETVKVCLVGVYMQHLMGIDGVIVALLQEITEAVSDMIMMKPSKVNEEERLEGDGKMEVKAKP